MFWNIVFAVAAFALQLLLMPKPQNAKPASLEDFDFPIAEEGVEIPVLFGTKVVKGPNVVWYGDFQAVAEKGPRRYLLFGPRQVIGHKYYLGMQMCLSHGELDALREIKVQDKSLFRQLSYGGGHTVNAPDILGSNAGGITGDFTFYTGSETQNQDTYLQSVLGNAIPAYRGIAYVVLNKMYLGKNAYLQPWSFKITRIGRDWEAGSGGVPPVAGIDLALAISMDRSAFGNDYRQAFKDDFALPYIDWIKQFEPERRVDLHFTDYDKVFFGVNRSRYYTYYDADAADIDTYYGNIFDAAPTAGWPSELSEGVEKWPEFFSNVPAESQKIGVIQFHNAEGSAGFQLQEISQAVEIMQPYGSTVDIYVIRPQDGRITEGLQFLDNQQPFNYSNVPDTDYLGYYLAQDMDVDMNPAHIIRECLLNRVWGMGYNEADLEDDTFVAAANTLFSEQFGMSLLWSREETIEDFVSMVLSHIDAVLYTSRQTGKFVLRLIRDDYDIETIPVIDEDDVVSWEEIKARQPHESVNYITIKYYTHSSEKDASLSVPNIAQIQQLGGIISTTRQYPGITRDDVASRVALRDLRSLQIGHYSGMIKVKRLNNLNPGDPFRLVSADNNLSGEVMRVAEIDFGDGRKNEISIKFLQDTFYLNDDVLTDPTSEFESPFQDPVVTDEDVIAEMTYYELIQLFGKSLIEDAFADDLDFGMLRIAAAPPQQAAIDAAVIVDGETLDEYLGYCPRGELVAAIDEDDTEFSITDDLNIEEVEIGAIALIGDEIVRVDDITEGVVTVGRGCLDSLPSAHVANTPIIFFGTFQMTYSEMFSASDSTTVELLTRTTIGTFSADDAIENTVEFDSRGIRPLRPANITVEGIAYGEVDAEGLTELTVQWARRNRTNQAVLDWTDADEAPEYDQTTLIEVLDGTQTVLTTYEDITGTSQVIPVSAFSGNSTGFLRIYAERDGYRSYRYWEVRVILDRGYGYAYGYNYGGLPSSM